MVRLTTLARVPATPDDSAPAVPTLARVGTPVWEHGYARAVRPALFRVGGGDAERAHHATLSALARLSGTGAPARAARAALRAGLPRPGTPVEVAGVRFPGRVGLAAGMDKDAVAVPGWAALGFGHVEVGTVTAHPQPGQDRPRLFRLPASGGLINRMGFNNAGSAALADRLRALRAAHDPADLVPIGVSIGKSKVTPVEDAVADYLTSVDRVAPLADYLAVNVSSPNTPGLRGLQEGGPLTDLLGAVTRRVAELAGRSGRAAPPVFVKVAPDLDDRALEDVLEVADRSGVAGLIATNTTLGRDGLAPADAALAAQAGGLSGRPLTARAREVVGFLTARTTLPVIGVGGVMSADDARALLDAGAALVQVYSGVVYAGPALIARVNALA